MPTRTGGHSNRVDANHYQQFYQVDFPDIKKYQDTTHMVFASTHEKYAIITRDTQDIISEIREARASGKKKIIFWNNPETFVYRDIHKIQRIAELLSSEIDKKDMIFTVCAPGAQEFYDDLCFKYNWESVLSVVGCDHFEKGIASQYQRISQLIDSEYNIEPKQKFFACFNRIHRKHRLDLLAEAIRNDWLTKSYYSFEGSKPHWYDQFLNVSEVDRQTILSIKDQYPLRLNITKERSNPADIQPEDLQYYKNSYFSVITETIMAPASFQDAYDHMDALFLSEKIYKPLAFRHPFIAFAQPGILRYLRECGYQTFHPYINEAYDDEKDYHTRFAMLISEIKRLEQFTLEQWHQWQMNIKPIVEHNAKYLSGALERKNPYMIKLFE